MYRRENTQKVVKSVSGDSQHVPDCCRPSASSLPPPPAPQSSLRSTEGYYTHTDIYRLGRLLLRLLN